MMGLIVLGSLAVVAGIVIYVANNLKGKEDSSLSEVDAVSRHHVTLSREQSEDLVGKLVKACSQDSEETVNFFVSDDAVLQITITKLKK